MIREIFWMWQAVNTIICNKNKTVRVALVSHVSFSVELWMRLSRCACLSSGDQGIRSWKNKYIMILVASVMRIFCSVILVWLETGSGLAADIPQASRLKPYT
jgi:hypothetical protein